MKALSASYALMDLLKSRLLICVRPVDKCTMETLNV